MTPLSLFQDEHLVKQLLKCINNNAPKDLEKTEWWNYLICESLHNEGIQSFIKYCWPMICKPDPDKTIRGSLRWHQIILDNLLGHCNMYKIDWDNLTFNEIIEDYVIDKKLIKTIGIEQKKIKISQGYGWSVAGPIPKPISVNAKNGPAKCVAVLEHRSGNFIYDNIHDFLISLSEDWIYSLNKGCLSIDCNNQTTDEKDSEIAEIIFSNFPETFSQKTIEEKHLYICGYNWNFLKSTKTKNDAI